ncbi:hypothetical protein ABPG72_003570 [Tetrahymena utriculariae]
MRQILQKNKGLLHQQSRMWRIGQKPYSKLFMMGQKDNFQVLQSEISKQIKYIPQPVLDQQLIEQYKYADSNLLLKAISAQKLLYLQKKFYQNTSYSTLYPYLRELNRQQKQAEILQLTQNLDKKFKFGTDIDKDKVNAQITYAKTCFELKNGPMQLVPQIQSKSFTQRIFNYLLYIYIFYLLFGNITIQADFSSDDNTQSSEEQSFFSKVWDYIVGSDKENNKKKSNDSINKNNKQEAQSNDNKQNQNAPKSNNLLNRFFNRGVEIQEEKNIKTRFSDVLGIDEFKEELIELVDYLKNPQKYHEAGAKLPKGILLVGPPGTGKTLLARALAGEAGCSFFYKSGSEFDEMFVGVGASRVRELFKKAREKAPSIIFIDEIDSVAGSRRSTDPSNSRDTVNQILAEMDGFKQTDNVIVIGATNFEQAIDPAIKRPGRFDKLIHVPLPDIRGREQLFEYYLKNIKYDPDVKAKELARQTSGFSGADISNMVNISILNSIKNNRTIANLKDFDFALDRIAMGIGRKNMFITEEDKRTTAIHEGGHTIAALLTDGATPLHKVTILPRGGALGFTSMIPETDKLNHTKKSMIAMIDVAMGGRAAEDIFIGNDQITTGCSSDLSKATEIAYQYVKNLGMNEELTLISASNKIQTSDTYNYQIDLEVQKLLKESYDRVKKLLKSNEKGLWSLVDSLVKNETLTAEQIKEIVLQGKKI